MINAAKMAIAGVIAVVFTLMSAGVAQAYPDPIVKVTGARLVGGLPVKFTATSTLPCITLTVTFNGRTKTGSGTSLSGTFPTPKVTKVTPKPITVSCSYKSTGADTAALREGGNTITLLPEGASTVGNTTVNGVLPNTGGSNLWILVVGGALVLVGGGAVVVSRRRS